MQGDRAHPIVGLYYFDPTFQPILLFSKGLSVFLPLQEKERKGKCFDKGKERLSISLMNNLEDKTM